MSSILKTLTPNMMVKNVNTTVDYYIDSLGFHKIMSVPEEGESDWAMIVRDSVTIMLQSQKSIVEEYPSFQNHSVGATVTFYFDIENIDNFFNSMKSKVSVYKGLHDTFYGRREFVIQDCNGYFLVFSEEKKSER